MGRLIIDTATVQQDVSVPGELKFNAIVPVPTPTTIGGVKSLAASAHQFLTEIGTDGTPAHAQPAAADVAGLAPSATTDTTNADNITAGTLPAARLPTPGPTALGGVKSLAAVPHSFLTAIGTDGSPAQAQPAAGDVAGLAPSATTDTTNADNITAGTLNEARLPATAVKTNVTANLTAGYTATAHDYQTIAAGVLTLDPTLGDFGKCVNGGPFELAPPVLSAGDSASGRLAVTNNATAGAITTSGWTRVVGSFDTVNAHSFKCFWDIGAEGSLLTIQAMQ